jgi:ssDNA-binding Zn-finger/Zn-ribbon topoisomerase 1
MCAPVTNAAGGFAFATSAIAFRFDARRLRHKEADMRECEVCGNNYDKPIEVVRDGESHFFDCFECAIHALAPVCDHCGCKIIGHGVEAEGVFYCCAHCAKKEGVTAVDDRA